MNSPIHMMLALSAVLLLSLAAAEGDEHFEFAGVFPVNASNGLLTWSMQKVDGEYADPEMKVVLIPSAGTKAALIADEDAAEALEEGNCPDVNHAGTMAPAASGSCFTLKVDDSKDTTTFTVDLTGITDLAGLSVFTAHVPTEFESDRHYLYDASDTDIEPVWTLGKTNAQFTCTKVTTVSADGGSSPQIWTVRQQSACNHDCSECDIDESHTTDRGEGDLKNEVCMEEDHCEDDVCEKEYILFRCNEDESDDVHVDMHVYEGVHNGVSVTADHCGDDNYHDLDEYVEYESGVCGADGHGHHTHGDHGSTNPVDSTPDNSKGAVSVSATAATAATVSLAAALAVAL